MTDITRAASRKSKRKPATVPPADALTYSVAGAAATTSLSVCTLYDLMNSGEIGFFHVGRRRLIDGNSLRAFPARQKPAATLGISRVMRRLRKPCAPNHRP